MKIYISHSREFDYIKELYVPLKESPLSQKYTFIFPHETEGQYNSKDIIKESDVILAEVSFPSTGQGIELGWAETFNIPIYCFHKECAKVSSSLKYITDKFNSYTNLDDMLVKIAESLPNNT